MRIFFIKNFINHASPVPICTVVRNLGRQVSKNYDVQQLSQQNHENLVYRVIRLQRLVNFYERLCSPVHICGKDKVRVDHPSFDEMVCGRTSMRKIALKLLYVGWNYTGYAWEDYSWGQKEYAGATNMVERVLLESLLRQQLIPFIGTMKQMSMVRCGRTDRQVSGLSQVVTVRVRSNVKEGYGVWSDTPMDEEELVYDEGSDVKEMRTKVTYHEEGFSPDDVSLDEGEIPYVQLLNNALPNDIRVLAWAPVSKKFNARHDCKSRTYRYVFPRGRLDIDLMNKAAQKLVGEHNFCNFCKRSDDNIFKHYMRTLISFQIEPIRDGHRDHTDLCVATICSKSFLHKQIRMMMALLTLIGMGAESPDIIDRLLDVEKTPRKPNYDCATPINLTMVGCEYDHDLPWRWDQDTLAQTTIALGEQYAEHAVKAEVLRNMYEHVYSKIHDADACSTCADSMSINTMGSGHLQSVEFDAEDSKTIEEKQESFKRSQLRSVIRKGSYRKARELLEEQSNPTTNQNPFSKKAIP